MKTKIVLSANPVKDFINIDDFIPYFWKNNEWKFNLKENIFFKIYWLKARRYKEEQDKICLESNKVYFDKEQDCIVVNNYYTICFDKIWNLAGYFVKFDKDEVSKFEKIEILQINN